MDTHAQKQKKTNSAGRQPAAVNEKSRSQHPFSTSLANMNDTQPPDILPGFEIDSPVAPRFGHHFADVRVHAAVPEMMIQTKLTINQPGDVYEQEADRVAEQVIQMETPASSEAPSTSQNARLGADDLFTRKEASDTSVHETASAPPLVDEVLSSGRGQPLDESTRSFMESRFGHDFSRVRVHADERSAESARSVNALGYTAGQDVVFGGGQYEPGTNEGKKLLAHELAHVVQQKHTPLRANNIVSAVALSRVSPNLVQRDVDPEKPGPWMHSEKENWPSSEPRAYSDLVKSVEERKSNIIASLDRPPKTEQETEQFKHQVRRLIRITALQMLVEYRATIQNKEDEFLNESSQESTQQNTKSGTAGRQSTEAIRTANVALLRLNNLKEELEEYANNLGSISTLTSSDAEMNFENWLIELRENTHAYHSPAVEQDLDYLTRRIRRGRPGPDERVLVWRIAQHEKEWRQKQITAVDISLRELYITFPFFTRLKPDAAFSVAPDQVIKREAVKGYMELLKNIDSVTTKIGSGNIDEFSLPAAVDTTRNALPTAVQASIDQLRTELQQQRLQEETGLQILQAVIALFPVIGPLAASTLGLKEIIDRNEISKASITPDQNVLGVDAPSTFDWVLETINGILAAVDLVGTLSGLGGDVPKKAGYEPQEVSGGSVSGKPSTGLTSSSAAELDAIVEKTPDIKKIRELAKEMESSSRGSLFERWSNKYIFKRKNKVRVVKADNAHLEEIEGGLFTEFHREIDHYDEVTGEIWDTKVYGRDTVSDREQLHDYRIMEEAGEIQAADGRTLPINDVNYLFSDINAAQDNASLIRVEGGGSVWYIDDTGALRLLP